MSFAVVVSLSLSLSTFSLTFSPYAWRAAQKPNSPHGLGRFFSLVSHLQVAFRFSFSFRERFLFLLGGHARMPELNLSFPSRSQERIAFSLFLSSLRLCLCAFVFEPVLTGLCVLTSRCPLKRKKKQKRTFVLSNVEFARRTKAYSKCKK